MKELTESIVRRTNTSRLGKLIHHPNKSQLDVDTLSYILTTACTNPNLQILLDNTDPLISFDKRITMLTDTLINIHRTPMRSHRVPFHLSEIDPRPYMTYTANGEQVMTNPTIFENFLSLSMVFWELYYLHPDNLGLETMLAHEIKSKSHLYPSLDDTHNLTDWEYVQQLKGTRAQAILADAAWGHGWKILPGYITIPQALPTIQTTFPRVNLRLETLVTDANGHTGPWNKLYPGNAVKFSRFETLSGYPITLVHDPFDTFDALLFLRRTLDEQVSPRAHQGSPLRFLELSGFI